MKPGFALSLSSEGIVLLHRAAGGWRNVGLVPLDSPDLPTALSDLRTRGDAIEQSGCCKLIIPNEQIRYLTIETGTHDSITRREMARTALEGATPYPVDDLAFDLSEDGTQTHIAAVALETLAEAESFALENGFTPASFVAVPGEMNFLGEPFFGPAPSFGGEPVDTDGIAVVDIGPAAKPSTEPAAKPQGKSSSKGKKSVKSDAALKNAPVNGPDKGPGNAPGKRVKQTTAELNIPKAPENRPSAGLNTPAKDSPVQPNVQTGLTKSAPGSGSLEESGRSDEDNGPVPGFSSRRRKTTDMGPIKLRAPSLGNTENSATAGATPALAGASRTPPPAPAQAGKSAEATAAPTGMSTPPDKSPSGKASPNALVSGPSLKSGPSEQPTATTAAPSPAAHGKIPAAPKSSAVTSTAAVADQPSLAIAKAEPTGAADSDARKSVETLTQVSQTSSNKSQTGGKPRHLGLILTVVLLLAMAAVAAFALLTEGEIFGSSSEEGQRQRPPVVEETPERTPPPEVKPEDSTASPEVTPEAEVEEPPAAIAPQVSAIPSQPDPGVVDLVEPTSPAASQQANLGTEVDASTDQSVLDALDGQPIQDPEPQSDGTTEGSIGSEPASEQADQNLEQAALYAATGIWHTVPQIAEAPALISLDDIYIASIDNSSLSQDAVALPPATGLVTDGAPNSVSSPAAVGSAFALDSRGLVIATPEGTLNPDGVMVYLGRPQKTPPATPERADPTLAEAEAELARQQARLAALASKRPRPRPTDLVEQAERALLGGLSREELASVRPRARPAGLKTEEQENQPVSDLAIVSSVSPRGRPANFANLVDRAKRRQAAAPAATAAAVPTIAPRTVTPSLPSSASVARQATVNNAINLRRLNLIGVSGPPADRRALVRLPSGRYKTVKVGDRIDGGTVVAIGDSQLRYQKRGNNTTLEMPGG